MNKLTSPKHNEPKFKIGDIVIHKPLNGGNLQLVRIKDCMTSTKKYGYNNAYFCKHTVCGIEDTLCLFDESTLQPVDIEPGHLRKDIGRAFDRLDMEEETEEETEKYIKIY